MNNTAKLQNIKELGEKETVKIRNKGLTERKPGSIGDLFNLPQSQQSYKIKLGKLGEILVKEMITITDVLSLLPCGCRDIGDGIKKDFDLLWIGEDGVVYYRELKANMELDSEKLPAMIAKIKDNICPFLNKEYFGKTIDVGILHWTVYDRTDLGRQCASHIKKCENNNIKVEHMSDFMKSINFEWEKNDFQAYFKSLGEILTKPSSS